MSGDSVVVGLTGGIASGKSMVSEILHACGACILDADAFSRGATEQGSDCYQSILDTFGCQIADGSGKIIRKALADIVFSDEEKRLRLNAIIHPYVLSCLQTGTVKAKAEGKRVIVWDVPLLLEVGWQQYTDCVIVVTADEKTRVSRIVKRDGCDEHAALKRIRAQMSDAEKCSYANFVIVNQSGKERLRERVEQVYHSICSGLSKGL